MCGLWECKRKGAVSEDRTPDTRRTRSVLLLGRGGRALLGLGVATGESPELYRLPRPLGRPVLVVNGDAELVLHREVMLDDTLLPLALLLRLAATALGAELADADVDASAVDGTTLVGVLAHLGARVAGLPLAAGHADHLRAADLAGNAEADELLHTLDVRVGRLDEGEAPAAEEAHVAHVAQYVPAVLVRARHAELDAADVDALGDGDVRAELLLLPLLLASDAEEEVEVVLLVVAVPAPVLDLVAGLQHLDDAPEEHELPEVHRADRVGLGFLVCSNLHKSLLLCLWLECTFLLS